MIVATTVNAAYRKFYTDQELAEFIKSMYFPDDRMYVLFTECSLQSILKLCSKYLIEIDVLKKYYDRFIKPNYQNLELEEFFQSLTHIQSFSN